MGAVSGEGAACAEDPHVGVLDSAEIGQRSERCERSDRSAIRVHKTSATAPAAGVDAALGQLGRVKKIV